MGGVDRNDTTYFFWIENQHGRGGEGVIIKVRADASDEELGRLVYRVLDDEHKDIGPPYFRQMGYKTATEVWRATLSVGFNALDKADPRQVSFYPTVRTKRLARSFLDASENEKASIDDLAACGRALRRAFERAT